MSNSKAPEGQVVALPWVELAQVVRRPSEELPAAAPTPLGDEELSDRLAERVRASERMAVLEQVQAPILFAQLLAEPAANRQTLVRNKSQFASYLLAEMLLEKCRETWSDDLVTAQETAVLASEVIDQLDADQYGESLVRSLRARALAFLANIERVKADFRKADEYFTQMEGLLAEDLLEPLEWAELMKFRASFYADLRQIDKANAILDRMMEIYREAEDTHQVGRALIQRAGHLWWNGDQESALEALEQGIPMIDGRREPRMVAVALYNLALYLSAADRSQEALEVLNQARPLIQQQGDRLNLIRAQWVEGRILASLGRTHDAEAAYQDVRKQFGERGLDHEQGMVCLDLAVLYAEENRNDKIRQLAAEMLPLFRSHNLGREVIAALILFQHAAEREIATLGLIREISSYLKRAQQVVWMKDED